MRYDANEVMQGVTEVLAYGNGRGSTEGELTKRLRLRFRHFAARTFHNLGAEFFQSLEGALAARRAFSRKEESRTKPQRSTKRMIGGFEGLARAALNWRRER